MAIKDHVTRVAKRRARVTLVDPSQRIIEVADATGRAHRLWVGDVSNSWTWPKVNEEWSIYEENGLWVLGSKFLSPEEAKVFESQNPGDQYPPIPPDEDFEVVGPYTEGDVPTWDATTTTWIAEAPTGGVGGDLHFTFNQGVPAATWNITHSLGKFPSVSVVDSVGNFVEGSIHYIDINSLTLTFVSAFSGVAYLN